MGCVLGEMLLALSKAKNKDPDMSDSILFPGFSCYPLSPDPSIKDNSADVNTISQNDQLIKIFEILGKQTPD